MKKKLVNGQKLAPQFRTARILIRTQEAKEGDSLEQRLASDKEIAAEIDETNRVVKNVSISSDEPYERYYGTEILSHEPGAVNLERVTSGAAPLLFNHDRDSLIGKISNPVLRGGKLYVDLKFSQSEAGQQMLKDLLDGILTELSIGYDVDKFEVDEEEETYRALRWTLYECSMVSIPADFTVGVGRAFEQEEKTVEIISKKDIDATLTNDNPLTTEKHMEKTPAELEAEKQQSETALTKAKDEATKAERERVNSIEALRLHFATKGLAGRKIDTTEEATKAIKEGKTVREFQDAVMVGTFKEIEAVVTDGDDPDGEKGAQVIGERPVDPRKRRGLTVGREFVNSKQFKEAANRRGQGARNASIDLKDVTMLGASGKSSLIQRAGFQSSDLAAINIQVLPGMVQLGMQRLTVMDLLTGGATDAAALPYAKENSFGTINGTAFAANTYPRAQTVGEGGQKPLWLPDLTTDIANVKKVAVVTRVPDEFMSDFSGMQSYIDNRLPYMVDLETEFQLLYGSGIGNDIKGIFTTQGVQARAIDTTSDTTIAASLKKGLTDVNVYSQFDATGYVFHPFDWETASLLKDSQGRFLAGGPFYIPYAPGVYVEMNTFWGKPVVVTTSCTYGKPLAGSWKLGAQYFIREGMRLETTNSNRDDFENNLIAIRAEHRLALATYRPIAFIEYTGMPART